MGLWVDYTLSISKNAQKNGSACHSTCDKYCPSMDRDSEDSRTEFGTDNLYYIDRSMPGLHEKLTELYYPSSTKSTYCEDDYFLSLSKDRTTFKPIRVCEL